MTSVVIRVRKRQKYSSGKQYDGRKYRMEFRISALEPHRPQSEVLLRILS